MVSMEVSAVAWQRGGTKVAESVSNINNKALVGA
jgi:hypothetical protein